MGAFERWLRDEPKMLTQLRVIEDYIRCSNYDLARSCLSRETLSILIKYTELSTTIKQFSEQPEQENIWLSHREQFDIDDFSLEFYSPLLPHQHIKGIFFYWLATSSRDTAKKNFGDDELEFLKKSAENHCYYAYNSLSTWAYTRYKEKIDESAWPAIIFAQEASCYHLTPGFFLLYKTYQNLAILNHNNRYYYIKALEALLIAKKIASNNESLKAINNTYFGEGLQMGNNFQFSSWDTAINHIVTNAKLSISEVNAIYNKISPTINQILLSIPKSTESLSTNTIRSQLH